MMYLPLYKFTRKTVVRAENVILWVALSAMVGLSFLGVWFFLMLRLRWWKCVVQRVFAAMNRKMRVLNLWFSVNCTHIRHFFRWHLHWKNLVILNYWFGNWIWFIKATFSFDFYRDTNAHEQIRFAIFCGMIFVDSSRSPTSEMPHKI